MEGYRLKGRGVVNVTGGGQCCYERGVRGRKYARVCGFAGRSNVLLFVRWLSEDVNMVEATTVESPPFTPHPPLTSYTQPVQGRTQEFAMGVGLNIFLSRPVGA